MKPLLLGVLALGGLLAAVSSSKAATGSSSSGAAGAGGSMSPVNVPPATGTGDPPDSVLNAVVAALATNDPDKMRAVAAQLRKQGWTLQAASLEEAAKLTEAAQAVGVAPPPVVSPSVPSVTPRPTGPAGGATSTSPGWPSVTPKPPPVPTAPPIDVSKVRLLKAGVEGVDVAAWQAVLKADGYNLGTTGPGGDGVDGVFGPKTTAATMAWQRARGLEPDGVVGPLTLGKIGTQAAASSSSSSAAINPSKWRTMRQGTAGADVKELQQYLAAEHYNPGPIDGVFGKQTTAAAKAWQAANGLDADGVIGAASKAKIASDLASSSSFAGDVAPLELLPSSPLPGIVPAMHPTPSVDPRRALAARTAAMLWNARPGEENRELVQEFQELVGAKATGFYGPGTALHFIRFGLVPPKPFYWSKKGARNSKAVYRNALLAQASKDPQRHDEWAAAAMVQ